MAIGRGRRRRALRALVLVLLPSRAATIRCLHSTCAENRCYDPESVSTEMVDCDTLVTTIQIEESDGSFRPYSYPAGRSANAPFDACQKDAIRLGRGIVS